MERLKDSVGGQEKRATLADWSVSEHRERGNNTEGNALDDSP